MKSKKCEINFIMNWKNVKMTWCNYIIIIHKIYISLDLFDYNFFHHVKWCKMVKDLLYGYEYLLWHHIVVSKALHQTHDFYH
jgi:hypothetical protein